MGNHQSWTEEFYALRPCNGHGGKVKCLKCGDLPDTQSHLFRKLPNEYGLFLQGIMANHARLERIPIIHLELNQCHWVRGKNYHPGICSSLDFYSSRIVLAYCFWDYCRIPSSFLYNFGFSKDAKPFKRSRILRTKSFSNHRYSRVKGNNCRTNM